MDPLIWIIVLGAALAGFVQGLSGFAFGLTAMSVWAWAVEPALAAPLAVFGGLCGQILAAFRVRGGFDLRTLAPFLAGGLAGIPLGVIVLPLLDVVLFKAALGAFLVVLCPLMFVAPRLPRVTFGGRLADAATGLVGGAMSGIGGLPGAVPALWCTLRGMDKEAQRAVVQNFNFALLAVTMAVYLAGGIVTAGMLPYFAAVLPAALVPAFVGTRLYLGISEKNFRRVVLTLLTASGVALLASSLPDLAARL